MATDTFKQVEEILRKILTSVPATISESSLLSEDLGADSFDALEIVVALEEKFGIEVDADKAAEIKTVGDLVNAIEQA